MLSKKRIDAMKGWDEVVAAYESKEIITAPVIKVINGGVIALFKGIRIFIPASLTATSKGESLESLLNKEISFKIIEANRNRRRVVASIREVLKEEKEKLKEKFWENAEVGQKIIGNVKTITNYGAFVDVGGIDGLVHISELSWNRIKHPSEVVNVGDTVEVYIKDLDKEKGKISLGYKKTEDNPWEILKRDYNIGDIIDVTIAGITDFGAFASILPGIDGLIHVSQISNKRIEKPQDILSIGDKVKVKIIGIDFDNKRVSLSMKELIEEEPEVETKVELQVEPEVEPQIESEVKQEVECEVVEPEQD